MESVCHRISSCEMAVSILQVLFTSGSCVCMRLYNSWRSGLKLVFVRGGRSLSALGFAAGYPEHPGLF